MLTLEEIVNPTNLEWQQLQEKLHHNRTLAGLVLAAWQIGLWLANGFVEAELNERAQQAMVWGRCPKCGATFHKYWLREPSNVDARGLGGVATTSRAVS